MWASHITVPVFLVGALEDEQTGPQWPALLSALKGDPTVYVTMLNGTHIDSIGPDTISRWLEFLDIYVAGRVPTPAPVFSLLAPAVYANATGGAKAMAVPPVRFTTEPSVAAAKRAYFAQDPRVRVLFDNGGGSLGPGAMQPTAEAGYSTWPPKGTTTRYYLGPLGSLGSSPPPEHTAVSFHPDPSVRPATDLPSGNAWAAQPPYHWTTVPAANGVAFETAPFATTTTIVGPASLDLWLQSSAKVTDLQATVTQVRPGETEEDYVTSGFLRSSYRTLLPTSTALDPVPGYRAVAAHGPAGGALHPRADPDRSDRPCLSGRHAAARRGVGSGRRPAVVGLRHLRHPWHRARHHVPGRSGGLVPRGQRRGRRGRPGGAARLRGAQGRTLPALHEARESGLSTGDRHHGVPVEATVTGPAGAPSASRDAPRTPARPGRG